jgi:hypothetical protein
MRYREHETFTPPDDPDAPLWRYIDFTKLVSLLDTESLFFARADTLGDTFEGSFSRANVEARPGQYPDKPEMLAIVSVMHQLFRVHTFINCWSLDKHESAALWRLYVPPEGGVAVKSSFRRLTECFVLSGDDDGANTQNIEVVGGGVLVGRVHYVDYERDLIPEGSTLAQFVHKRRSFEFEKEVRAVIQTNPVERPQEGTLNPFTVTGEDPRTMPEGKLVKVNLDVLVDTIHVSPVAPSWFSNLVESVCSRYGLSKPVIQSSLAGKPLY